VSGARGGMRSEDLFTKTSLRFSVEKGSERALFLIKIEDDDQTAEDSEYKSTLPLETFKYFIEVQNVNYYQKNCLYCRNLIFFSINKHLKN